MISWREGKAGFVGAIKYGIRGAYSFVRSVTTSGPLPPGIEWIEGFDGILVNQRFDGSLVNQSFNGILGTEATFNGTLKAGLFRVAVLVNQRFDGILVNQEFDGEIDT